jgi:putative oxidoreductase
MFYPIRGILALLGRICIVAIFLLAAVGSDIPKFHDTVAEMHRHNVPYPEVLLPGAIIFLIVGSLLVLFGYKARFGALLLLIFLGLATYYFHNFWDLPAGTTEQKIQMIQFFKNLSLAGTMLFIMAVGAGPFSLDGRWTDTA